jgi:hypothetical protein
MTSVFSQESMIIFTVSFTFVTQLIDPAVELRA